MKKTFLKVPYILTYSRLVIALYFVLVGLIPSLQNAIAISLLLIYAIVSDIFDGIVARKMKVDSVHLRQLDSKVDTIFWITLLYVLLIIRYSFIRTHAAGFFILLGTEIAVQLFGYLKFSKTLALHTYAAKAWVVLLTITVLQLLLNKHAEVIFYITFTWGLLTQLEIICIIIKLKTFKVDIKSFFVI